MTDVCPRSTCTEPADLYPDYPRSSANSARHGIGVRHAPERSADVTMSLRAVAAPACLGGAPGPLPWPFSGRLSRAIGPERQPGARRLRQTTQPDRRDRTCACSRPTPLMGATGAPPLRCGASLSTARPGRRISARPRRGPDSAPSRIGAMPGPGVDGNLALPASAELRNPGMTSSAFAKPTTVNGANPGFGRVSRPDDHSGAKCHRVK